MTVWIGDCLDPVVSGARIGSIGWLFALAICVGGCSATRPADPFDDSIAAGFHALTTCSAVFVADRPPAALRVDELAGVYRLPTPVEPRIDFKRRVVTVPYDAQRPERVAVYRGGEGCTILPPGVTLADLRSLRTTPPRKPKADLSKVAWPDGDALPARPSAKLAPLLDRAFDGTSYGAGNKTVSVVVVQGGEVVAERYRRGFDFETPVRTWSVAKSLNSALVGIAVGEGLLTVDQPAPIPEWDADDPRSEITIDDLLHMSSGLRREGTTCYPIYFGGAGSIDEITSAPLEVEPGARWHYSNRDTLLLVRSLRAVLGSRYRTFPYDALFTRIGMHHTTAEQDIDGNFVLSSQVYSTARDLARFGLLYLQDGVWNGERILPVGWVDYTRTNASNRPTGIAGLWRHGLVGLAGYGAQFWLFGDLPGLPDDTYSAAGSRGQMVTIIPSQELVVVRMGLDAEHEDVFWRQDQFVSDVIEALAPPTGPPPGRLSSK